MLFKSGNFRVGEGYDAATSEVGCPWDIALLKSIAALDRYRWCGHSVLMGRVKNDWQDRNYVLRQFGRKEKVAKKA